MKYRENESEPWKELYIKALDSMPIGSIIGFAGTDIPNGWLICDGSTLDEETYPELYDALGGSGSTFTLPDCKGRVVVGYDANDTDFNAIGKTGGSKELQKHTHLEHCSTETINVQAGSSATCPKNYPYTNTGETGDGTSGNLQPYYVAYKIIKAKNTTPTMASIVNTKNNSTTDGYSCKFINDSEKYSTTEVKTNKTWLGKPIYRKVIEATNIGTAFSTGVSNIDTFMFDVSHSYIYYDSNMFFASDRAAFLYNKSSNTIKTENTALATWSAKLTIEYTKTTD
jgi:microcystin-dependent protein